MGHEQYWVLNTMSIGRGNREQLTRTVQPHCNLWHNNIYKILSLIATIQHKYSLQVLVSPHINNIICKTLIKCYIQYCCPI